MTDTTVSISLNSKPSDELLDVVGIGSPLVDVIARTSDELLDRLQLTKGSMELVDLDQAESIYASMGSSIEISGGSAANTMAGIAALGGRAGFIGKVAADTMGDVFTHDITTIGVEFEAAVVPAQGAGTGRCLVLVTDDAVEAVWGARVRAAFEEHALPLLVMAIPAGEPHKTRATKETVEDW